MTKVSGFFSRCALGLIDLYQITISPDKSPLFRHRLGGRICAHEPHCSEYARECFQKHSFLKAVQYSMERVSSCVPRYEKLYDPSSYRVVFFSSSPIGTPFLKHLAEDSRFDLVGVVTMPDAPVGRGMKVQENIIKQEAKKIITDRKKISKVVLLHGKDATPEDKWYPWFIHEMNIHNIPVLAPYLPKKEDPVLEERLDEIDKLGIDEHTVVIGHSRGGVALLRRIETRKKPIGKIILVATNDSVYAESRHGFFTDRDYEYTQIKKQCADITVFHYRDDETVPFSHGQKIASGLQAKSWFPTGYGHFGRTLPKFPELIPYVIGTPFVNTPRSLRLDSKKYADDAHAFQERVTDLQPDLFVVIAYGHIMPQWVLDIPVFGSINVHGSLLPEYRGASPLQSVFLDGKETTGLTIMKMDAGVDTGLMIKKLPTPLPLSRTVIDLIAWIKTTGPGFLNEILWSWGKGLLTTEVQDDSQATLCRKFEKEDGEIDPFHDDLLVVWQKWQAFALWPKLYFFWEGKRVSIDTFVLHEEISRNLLQGEKLISQTGTVFSLHSSVASIRFIPEGKKSLTWEEFVNGYIKE